MKSILLFLPAVVLTVCLLATRSLSAQEASVPPAAHQNTAPASVAPLPESAVGLLDDQTGAELLEKHGINTIQIEDLAPLLDGVLNGGRGTRLLHWMVDEDASDNTASVLDLLPYAGGKPPVPPKIDQTTRELVEAAKQYREQRAHWQAGVKDYSAKLQANTDHFVRAFQQAQLETAARFDQIADALVRRGKNADFNRSDIQGTITGVVEQMKSFKMRLLIINSDCVDAPMKKEPRHSAFTKEELPEDIVLIFVSTSHVPDKSVLFKGLKNPRHHADSMRAAVEIATALLAETAVSTTAATR